MKRIVVRALAVLLCLCLAACGRTPAPVQAADLTGSWQLDPERNDLTAFEESLELFPGYGEWGAAMELQDDGQLNWAIGAEGWHGRYTVQDDTVLAEMTSDLDQTTRRWEFRIVGEAPSFTLELDYPGRTVYWVRAS